jgi:hypothetical protein
MYRIFIQRICEVKAPFDICVETNNDWTHFTHLHRTTIADYRLLFKNNQREVFLYRAKWFAHLPFHDTYIIFRNYEPVQHGYRNIYFNIRSGLVTYLDARVERKGDSTLFIGDYIFVLPSYWRYLSWLFLIIFKLRMRRVMDEDNEWIYGLMTRKTAMDNPVCAPVVPAKYDLYDDLFADDVFATADVRMSDYSLETFDGRGRFKIKHERL